MGDGTAPYYVSPAKFDSQRIQAAVYCSDGQYGEQFDDLLHNALKLPRYDRVAVPGGAACLARHFQIYREEEGVAEQLRFLIAAHKLERVILIAHKDCGFFLQRLQVSPLQLESQQREDMLKAITRVQSLGRHLRIEAYFARQRRGMVQFERVA